MLCASPVLWVTMRDTHILPLIVDKLTGGTTLQKGQAEMWLQHPYKHISSFQPTVPSRKKLCLCKAPRAAQEELS